MATTETKEHSSITKTLLGKVEELAIKVDAVDKALKAPDYRGNDPARIFATPKETAEEAGRWTFKSLGHFMHEVRKSQPHKPSEYIAKVFASEQVTKAATGMGELVGSDGGFLVPPTYANTIFARVYAENNLLDKTDKYPVSGNTMTFPRSAESSRADGSRWGGVQSFWVQEGSTITPTAPTFGQLKLNLHKLATLVRLTSELKTDAGGALDSYLTKVFSSEIAFETGKAIYRGNGVGRPLGMINSACAVTVSKEAGQAPASIVPQNIVKMWARRFTLGPTGSYLWLKNQDVDPALQLMTLGIGTAGLTTYMPPGGLSGAPYATLMGAQVMDIEWASTLGAVGDIALVDPSQYVTISQGGPQTMSSLHVYFTTDEEAVRTTWRIDGQPWWASALTPYQGTNTQSPIILLATRA